MDTKKWTDSQKAAITVNGGSVTVSASAGSGKSSALVQRIISKITDPYDPVPIDRFLIMTFSNAAANDIKFKIRKAVSDIVAVSPENNFLASQLIALDNAEICTVHSFCLELIRSNFEKLNLNPDFRVIDDKELSLLMDTAASEVLESYYARSSPAFLSLCGMLSNFRDDKNFVEIIFKLYEFVRARPFYNLWIQEIISFYDAKIPFEKSVWGDCLFNYFKSTLKTALAKLDTAFDLLKDCDPKLSDIFAPRFSYLRDSAEKCLGFCRDKNWDGLYCEINSVTFKTLEKTTKFDKEKTDTLKSIREGLKKIFGDLKETAVCDSSAYTADIKELRPIIEELFSIISDFDGKLAQMKSDRGVIDFSDMEHYTLRLLFDCSVPYPFPKSSIAYELEDRFDEILIDEFQDTNAAQDKIFSALSKNGENIFTVGDVKQSIYRFRQAMPEIFLNRLNSSNPLAADGETQKFPVKIVFGENFRSRSEILYFTNYIFSQIMSPELGEIKYDSSERLIPFAKFPEEGLKGVELKIIETSQTADNGTRIEAAEIAKTIRRLIDSSSEIYDDGQLRPVRPGDFAILLRSTKNKLEIYSDELSKFGLSVSCIGPDDSSFLSSPEVSAVVSMLKIMVNPVSDMDLAAVLLSEIFSFSPDDLARIRLFDRSLPLFSSLKELAAENKDPFCSAYRDITYLRTLTSSMPCGAFIRKFYDYTSYFAFVSGNDPSGVKTANLNLLIKYAEDYDSHSIHGLEGFVRYVNKLSETGRDFSPSSIQNSGDCVKLMSIHSSKGLEFPVVFLSDCCKKFNMQDLNRKALIHPNLGFSCVRTASDPSFSFSTLPHEVLKLQLRSSMLSEEMRVLYVALTRAKSKLYITAHLKNPESKLKALDSELTEEPEISPYRVRKCGSFFDWIVSAALKHPCGTPLKKLAQSASDHSNTDTLSSEFTVDILKSENVYEKPDGDSIASPPASPELTQKIKTLASFSYPFESSLKIPSKITVSEYNSSLSDSENFLFSSVPSFLKDNSLSPSQIGSINHRFLQLMDLKAAAESPENELKRLCSLNFFSEKEAAAVKIKDVKVFTLSDIFKGMLNADKLFREYKFIYNIPSEKLGFEKGELISLQGIADCVFIKNGELTVVDYKTDNVKSGDELVERYKNQLFLYSSILSEIFEMPVSKTVIYSFKLGKEIILPKITDIEK